MHEAGADIAGGGMPGVEEYHSNNDYPVLAMLSPERRMDP